MPQHLPRLALPVVIAFLILSALLAVSRTSAADEPRISRESIDILSRTGQAMAEVSAAVKPAVVNISSARKGRSPGGFDPFFDDFPFGRPRQPRQASLGSGVIVDANGYILTNFHVIRGADDIKVTLSDKREFKGTVVGTDPKTDLAVIRIQADRLPKIRWGDSSKMRVGETVIAIGNPYGLSLTVTSGIVSATGRANVGIADYEDFIQTDAAINPGNSGGALVNIRGELVGINTAIFSTSGGYQGIGFAIPSSMAKAVMENLTTRGKVVRGWLGVSVQQLTKDLAQQFKVKEDRGILVTDINEGSPAAKAGLARGDILIEYDGKEVNDPSLLRNMVAATPPGKAVTIKFIRNESRNTVTATIVELPDTAQKVSTSPSSLSGVHVQTLTAQLRKMLRVPGSIQGVVVVQVEQGSAAENLLFGNDVIMEINKKRISSRQEYDAIAAKLPQGQAVILRVYRNNASAQVTIPGR